MEVESTLNATKLSGHGTRPGTCLHGIDGLCDRPTVAGHIIPRSRLNLIAESGKVQVFEPIPFTKRTGASREARVRPVPVGIATTEFYLCDYHEKRPFQEIEQADLCWEVSRPKLMRQLMLLAYKALLPTCARQEWASRAWTQLAELSGDEKTHVPDAKSPGDIANDFQDRLSATTRMKRMLEQWLRDSAYENMAHYITQTGSQPIVASNAFFMRSSVEVMEVNGPVAVSIPALPYRAPQCITAYPSGSGQWVVRSWLTPDSSNLKIRRISRSNVWERYKEAVAASVLLLEEYEVIAVGPKAWREYGELKRETIWGHFEATTPYSGTPIVPFREMPAPQLLNLFNTTPI